MNRSKINIIEISHSGIESVVDSIDMESLGIDEESRKEFEDHANDTVALFFESRCHEYDSFRWSYAND